jgi:hypothetical protein
VSKRVVIRYEREDDLVRFTLENTTNHELREILVGLWCRLGDDDRADHIQELTHYRSDPDAWLSPVATAVGRAEEHESSIDLKALIARGEKVRP